MKSPTIFLFFFLISTCALLLEASNNGGGGSKEVPDIKRSDFPLGFLFGAATSAYQIEGAYLDDSKSLSNWDVVEEMDRMEISLTIIIIASNNGGGGSKEVPDIKRSDFPLGFLFGAATSAYQIEGAYLDDSKSLSNWDVFCHSVVGCGRNGSNGDIADDHYHRFYNMIIDNLILKGIEPFVTIFHGDFPQELEDKYGSWLNAEMTEEFAHLAEICFKSFGDRVKYWATINEPNIFTDLSYQRGVFPPSRCSEPFGNCIHGNSDVEPLIVMHNFELDRKAAKRALAFNIGWSLDPVIFGEYPEEMREYLGTKLPSFSIEEKNFLKNSTDFIGINHYTTIYTKDCTNSGCSPTANRAIKGFLEMVEERDGVPIGEPTKVKGFSVVPRGMGEIVNYIKIRYNNTPMFITENGYSTPDVDAKGIKELVNDVKRVKFHTAYLASLAESIIGGADVRGYFIWSLMDNFEWLQGYDVKFGLYYIDRRTLTRLPKLSAKWYENFLKNKSDVMKFYNMIIDNLILKGIEPFVTIFHGDFPQELEDKYGSWLNAEMTEEFAHLAEICFKSFGDRVKYWATINEPNMFTELSYERGVFPPSRCSEPFGNCIHGNSDVEPLIVMHNFELDRKAAKRALAFNIGWSLDPVIFGEYPEEMREYLGTKLPSFSIEEKNFLKNSTDFIGINHYTTIYTKDCTNSGCSPTANRAIKGFLEMVEERDGYSTPDVDAKGIKELVNDVKRVKFHAAYLASLAESIRGGADVRGYFIWSLMDNFEWLQGYDAKFGELDRKAAKRALAFNIGWSLDPVIFGEYPEEMHEYLGTKLPSFSVEEKNFLKNSTDFIGINHYTTIYTKDCTNSGCSPTANRAIKGFLEMVEERDGVPIGEPTKVKGFSK
ncbi:Glycoside hydrolase, catalytic domain-containing protein [Cynara cardunculus var. scolymus]|uniref:Glycoside hydrolase, catalytic domain-containing protein n=1 Tax=Cynara cardunculus var. scolymus TaxID=59895 RepID=A0A124SDY8_CYNCS|nr:Glycoside hydrolase, catalytic domain-containing protein [Cynara cardunculus var. scolymus]